MIQQITDNSYNDSSPQINAAGQIVWYGSDGTHKGIYLYDHGVISQITNNADDVTQINGSGQIIWSAAGTIYLFGGNRDYYIGTVYADLRGGTYYPGYTKFLTTKSEIGCYGRYEIIGLSYTGVASTKYGQVFVTTLLRWRSDQKIVCPR